MGRTPKNRLEVVSQDNSFIFRRMQGPELLIRTVEKYPCLWDTRNDNHFKKDLREEAWKKVCEEVYNDWHSADEKDKWKKCTDLKKKWTHMRDYYRKDLMRVQNLPVGANFRQQKRYVFSEMLDFLAPIFDTKNTEKTAVLESDSTSQEDLEYAENLCYEESGYTIAEPATNRFSNAKPTSASTSTSTITNPTRKRKTDATIEFPNTFKQETSTPLETIAKNDDDTNFLLSLRGDLKQLNHSQKLDFKIGVLQLIQKFMYSDQTKRPKLSIPNIQNETEDIMPTVIKLSPVFENEHSQNSFDNSEYFDKN